MLPHYFRQALFLSESDDGNKKFVISKHHARGDFLKRVAKVCKCLARSRICAGSCPIGDNANFVGNNHEAAVSNLFEESYSFSKRLLLLFQPLIC